MIKAAEKLRKEREAAVTAAAFAVGCVCVCVCVHFDVGDPLVEFILV